MFVILKQLSLTKGVNRVGHNPKTVIFSSSWYKLTKQKKSYLSTGLIWNIQILYYHLNYYIENLSWKNFLVKIKLLNIATFSYAKIKSCRIKSNLSSSEAKALRIYLNKNI